MTAPASLPSPPTLKIVIASTPLDVRRALEHLTSGLRADLSEDGRNIFALVLAEVLNNVVEHAYSGRDTGSIEVVVMHDETHLRCTVRDEGRPMPGLTPPPGTQAAIDVPVEALPEGGFGWFMIRELSCALSYERIDGRNCLDFTLDLAASTESGREF